METQSLLTSAAGRKRSALSRLGASMRKNWQLYALLAPVIIYFILFKYLPMYGVQIAFRNYKVTKGITGSAWVGLMHFRDFFDAYYFGRLVFNTLILNATTLIVSFPASILLALMINQLNSKRMRTIAQTVVYVPHFISTVVLAGMLYIFLSPTTGIVNKLLEVLGAKSIFFMSEAGWFRPIYILSGLWQNAGWNSILYVATLTSIDMQLYEAAKLDGASKLQGIWYIELPHLLPMATMMLILNCGSLLSSSTDKVLLMQTSGNLATSDILGTYIYTLGLSGGQFSYTAAIGLFTNLVNFVLLLSTNSLCKVLGGERLF